MQFSVPIFNALTIDLSLFEEYNLLQINDLIIVEDVEIGK